MKQFTTLLAVTIFFCFSASFVPCAVAESTTAQKDEVSILDAYLILAPETWFEKYQQIYNIGMEVHGSRIVYPSDKPWEKNFKELREILDENGAAGYAIEFFDDGPFDVKECYRFFDASLDPSWEKLGTITPKGGKTYVIFIPSHKQ